MFFTPIAQATPYTDPDEISVENSKHFAGNLIFHYRGDEASTTAAVRAALKAIDPEIPILQAQSYRDQLNDTFVQEQLVVRLTSLFGILALTLAAIGLYGVTAYGVVRRTGEIGIRMALGASRGRVLGLILRGALTQATLGLALGVPLSLLGFCSTRFTKLGRFNRACCSPWLFCCLCRPWLPHSCRRGARRPSIPPKLYERSNKERSTCTHARKSDRPSQSRTQLQNRPH